MKKLFLLLVLTCLVNIGLAQTILEEISFNDLARPYTDPVSNSIGAFHYDSGRIDLSYLYQNEHLPLRTLHFVRYRNGIPIRFDSMNNVFGGSLIMGNAGLSLIATQTLMDEFIEDPYLFKLGTTDSLKKTPLLPFRRNSINPAFAIKLFNGLNLAFIGVNSIDPHRRFIYINEEGDTLSSFRIERNAAYPTSFNSFELTSDTNLINIYSVLGSNILKEVLNLRLKRIESREVIYTAPGNRVILGFNIHSLPNNGGYYVMNGINIQKVRNGVIEWTNTTLGSRLGRPFVTMDGDIIGISERGVETDTSFTRIVSICKVNSSGQTVWQAELGRITRFWENGFDPFFRDYKYTISSVEGMADGSAIFGGSRLDFINDIYVDGIATPVLIRLSNVGLRYEPGYPVVTSVREREPRASIKIYPNPTKSSIQVSVEGTKVNYPILVNVKDVLGKSLQSQMLYSSEEKVQVEHLSKGVYLLELEGIGTQKFVKE